MSEPLTENELFQQEQDWMHNGKIVSYQKTPQPTPEQDWRENLKKICDYSGMGMCPGCGLTPEGLDALIEAAERRGREEERQDTLARLLDNIEKHDMTVGNIIGYINAAFTTN